MSKPYYNRKFKDFIGIPLTSNPNTRDHTIPISSKEMASGSLTVASVAKVDKIFSLEQKLIVKTYGQLHQNVFDRIRTELIKLVN